MTLRSARPAALPLAVLFAAAGLLATGGAAAGPAERGLEGAIGLVVKEGPAFPGASDRSVSLTPAGFVRWGRFSLSGAGGFTTRQDDEVDRGLAARLGDVGPVRMSLGLRYDNGRRESESGQLAGMGSIKPTWRTRLGARWTPAPGWRVATGISVDTLNRGGGYFADLSVSRRWSLAPHQSLTVAAGITGAGDRFLQAWHGVSQAQAQASGYPAYKAREGLRDVQLSATWRSDFTPGWSGFVGLQGMRLLGAAADSPLTGQRSTASLSGGLVWRF